MLKIGVMCHSGCGGSARIATETAFELARRGHRVTLFTRSSPFFCAQPSNGVKILTLSDDEDAGGISELKVDWPIDDMSAMTRMVESRIAAKGLDVLHIHYALPFAFIAGRVREKVGKEMPALVATLHGTDVSVYGADHALGPALARALGNFDAVTTVSESHSKLAQKLLDLKRAPQVIPGFVDLKRFFPEVDRLHRKRPRILHMSNFRPVKDPRAVARIFLAIRKRTEAELWLVGDGEEMPRLKEVLRGDLNNGHVRFFGFQENVGAIIQRAHLMLMPSRSESFCLSALESMACGVPVLASHVGGINEVVVHQKTGFLFPPQDYEAAADWAVRLLADPASYEIVSLQARRQAARFDLDTAVSRYEHLYARVIAKKNRHFYIPAAQPDSRN